MAGLSIKLDMTGDLKKFESRLDKLVGIRFRDLTDDIGQALENSTLERFKTGTGPDGQAWQESGRVTAENARAAARKSRKKGKTLVDTARLKNSIHHVADENGTEVGTDVVYARIHQLGGETGRNKATQLPARPYLGMSTDDEQMAQKMTTDFFEGKLK